MWMSQVDAEISIHCLFVGCDVVAVRLRNMLVLNDKQ